MRAVLIVNPNATSTTPAGRDLLAHALESRVKLTVAHTDHRGHAIEIARDAARDGIDVLIVHGGDGTVNEVVNGVLGECGLPAHADAPAVGVVPGGSANVFARALGISPDPIEATNQLIDLLGEHRRGASLAAHRADGLRRALGGVHRGHGRGRRRGGRRRGAAGQGPQGHRRRGTSASAMREMLASARREPTLTLHLPDRDPVPGVHFAFVSNSSPWTYANARPVWTNPTTTFETGLGVFAITSMNVWAQSAAGAPDAVEEARDRAPST